MIIKTSVHDNTSFLPPLFIILSSLVTLVNLLHFLWMCCFLFLSIHFLCFEYFALAVCLSLDTTCYHVWIVGIAGLEVRGSFSHC